MFVGIGCLFVLLPMLLLVFLPHQRLQKEVCLIVNPPLRSRGCDLQHSNGACSVAFIRTIKSNIAKIHRQHAAALLVVVVTRMRI